MEIEIVETLNATLLRQDLFKTIEKVLLGFEVRVKTKSGNVILIDEAVYLKKKESRKSDLLSPKAKGKIHGSLDDADVLLRKHLTLPA